MIDPQEHANIKTDVERLGLDKLSGTLAALLSRIKPEANNPVDTIVWPHIVAQYQSLMADYELKGIIRVPPEALPQCMPFALQEGTNAPVGLSDAGNALFVGKSGSGKTTGMQGAKLAAYCNGRSLFIADGKNDSRFWQAIAPDFALFDHNTPVNLLEKPAWRTLGEHITEVVEWFRRSFYSGETQAAVLRKALTLAFSQHNCPSWQDVHQILDQLAKKTDTYTWRDACIGASERLAKVAQRYRVPYATRVGTSLNILLRKHTYVPFLSMDPVGEWAITTLLYWIFQRNKHFGIRDITTIASIDEGIGLLSKAHAASGIAGTNSLATLATMNREYGLRLWFSTVDLSATESLIINTVSTIALLPGITDELALRRVGLTPAQINTARHLGVGQVMLIYPGQLAWPVIANFPPLPEGLKDRRPAPAKEPSLPKEPPSPTIAEPAAERSVTETTGQPAHPRILRPEALAMLRHLSACGIDLVSETYKAAKLHYSQGDRIKTELIELGLISATPIIARSGRGGRGIALQLSSAGWDALGHKAIRHSRGATAQSEFLIQQLHRLIPHSSIEVRLG